MCACVLKSKSWLEGRRTTDRLIDQYMHVYTHTHTHTHGFIQRGTWDFSFPKVKSPLPPRILEAIVKILLLLLLLLLLGQ